MGNWYDREDQNSNIEKELLAWKLAITTKCSCSRITQRKKEVCSRNVGLCGWPIALPFWDLQKRRYRQTVINRMKENLVIEEREARSFIQNKLNEGVISDEIINLKASTEKWRLIHYMTPEGQNLVFLTNDMDLLAGLVAFLYSRR
ncbi:MAG: hypothetical protein P8144_03725 [Gammaproteobacteria bacterium]